MFPRILDPAMPRLGFVNAMMMTMKLPILVSAEKLESETKTSFSLPHQKQKLQVA